MELRDVRGVPSIPSQDAMHVAEVPAGSEAVNPKLPIENDPQTVVEFMCQGRGAYHDRHRAERYIVAHHEICPTTVPHSSHVTHQAQALSTRRVEDLHVVATQHASLVGLHPLNLFRDLLREKHVIAFKKRDVLASTRGQSPIVVLDDPLDTLIGVRR